MDGVGWWLSMGKSRTLCMNFESTYRLARYTMSQASEGHLLLPKRARGKSSAQGTEFVERARGRFLPIPPKQPAPSPRFRRVSQKKKMPCSVSRHKKSSD